jgi:hypothetical protein
MALPFKSDAPHFPQHERALLSTRGQPPNLLISSDIVNPKNGLGATQMALDDGHRGTQH